MIAASCALAGCSFTPGAFRAPPTVDAETADGSVDADSPVVDASPDAAPDSPPVFDPATDCPAAYTLTIGTSPTRYRVITSEGPFATQHGDCNDDLVDATHLASPETAVELMDIRTYLAARTLAPSRKYYVGTVQLRDQTAVDTGWIVFAGGGPLPGGQWEIGEPEDAGGGENNAQNVSSLWVDTGLTDSTGNLSYGAICECDGMPIDADAVAALP